MYENVYVCVITLQVYETAGMSSTLLAEVYAPVPDVNSTGGNMQLSELEFSSSQKNTHSHAGVGSGKSTKTSCS